MEDGYKLHDYSVNLNDVILLMVREKIDVLEDEATSSNINNVENSESVEEDIENREIEGGELEEAESLYYRIGDAVDCLDQCYGAWSEAIIQNIYKRDERLIFSVKWEFDNEASSFDVFETFIRPRARCLIPFNELSIGQKVMINYNVDSPKDTGLWYDFTISKLEKKRRSEELIGVLHIGRQVI